MKTARTMVFAAVAVLLLAGCNTFEGVGKDVASVGRTVEDAAK